MPSAVSELGIREIWQSNLEEEFKNMRKVVKKYNYIAMVRHNLQISIFTLSMYYDLRERVAEWLRHLTRKPEVRTAVGSNPMLDSLVALRNSSPGRPEPCEGNLVAAAGSCGGLMVAHPWPLLKISLLDFRRLATLNIYTYHLSQSLLSVLLTIFVEALHGCF